jgi:hypothetical protein
MAGMARWLHCTSNIRTRSALAFTLERPRDVPLRHVTSACAMTARTFSASETPRHAAIVRQRASCEAVSLTSRRLRAVACAGRWSLIRSDPF